MRPPYTIKTGIRRKAVSMAQRNLAAFWAHIFVDCTMCDQSMGLEFFSRQDAGAFTDEEAEQVFMAAGWRKNPTRCPVCATEDRFVYVGRKPCGCVVGIATDNRNRMTAEMVREFIQDGLTVTREPWSEYERIAEEETFMACPHGQMRLPHVDDERRD